MQRPDQVDHIISRLGDVGNGNSFGSRGVRVEDAEKIEAVGFDPVEGFELLIWLHDEPYGTLCLIPYHDHFFDSIVFSGKQTTRFQRSMVGDMLSHFLPLFFGKNQLQHVLIGQILPAPGLMR